MIFNDQPFDLAQFLSYKVINYRQMRLNVLVNILNKSIIFQVEIIFLLHMLNLNSIRYRYF